MKTPKMVEAMSYIDDDLVSGAINSTKKKKAGWMKWGAMAACLCLVIAGAVMWTHNPGLLGNSPHSAAGPELGGTVPEGVDPVMASVAIMPAGADLLDVADATSVSISEEDARAVEGLGYYIPNTLPEGCRYGKAAYSETTMKDGTRYHMIRVTYEDGQPAMPAPVPENAEVASAMTGNTAFVWMVWGHRPDTELPVYQPEEVSASLIERQEGRVFYIDYNGIYVGVERCDISAEDLLCVIESIG